MHKALAAPRSAGIVRERCLFTIGWFHHKYILATTSARSFCIRWSTGGTANSLGRALRLVSVNHDILVNDELDVDTKDISLHCPFMITMFSQACPMFASEFDKALAAGVNTIIIIISTIIVIIIISIEIKSQRHLHHHQVKVVAAGVRWDGHGNSFFTKLLPIVGKSSEC